MRILHLIPQLSGGGAERQLSYLAPELASMGHEIHIAYLREGKDMPELPGVVLHQLSSRSNYDPFLLWQLLQLVRKIKPDIIHTWIVQMDILGGIVAKVCGVPWIVREPCSGKAYSRQWKGVLRAWIGSKAQIIVSNSRGGDEYWKKKSPRSRRYVIPNALPIMEIDNAEGVLLPGLVGFEIPIILYAGRLTAQKNPQTFLKTIVSITGQLPVFGLLCGEGEQRFELENLITDLRLDADVRLMGHVPAAAVWMFMKHASVFVSLSAFEGRPNTVMEAMACGCPLVVSDIPAHREILDESCALFVDPANIQQIADTVIEALSDVDAAKNRTLIARGRTREWSIKEMARNYDRVYKEARGE